MPLSIFRDYLPWWNYLGPIDGDSDLQVSCTVAQLVRVSTTLHQAITTLDIVHLLETDN